jgi:hypothetical protein
MAIGKSGRIVINVDPEVVRRLYSALASSRSSLKDWFLKNALIFCDANQQPPLFTKTFQRPRTLDGNPPIDKKVDI